jgi:hypothetical protein
MPLERSKGVSAGLAGLANQFDSDKGTGMDDLEVDDFRLEFERFIEFISGEADASESRAESLERTGKVART